MKNSKLALFISSFFLISLLWTTLANENLFAQPDNITSEIGTNHAFIIGIEKYDDSAWGSSRNSVKDANKIAKILKEKYNYKPENVTLLTDNTPDKPDYGTIGNYLGKYNNSLTDNDNLLIFFSGHSEEDEDGETYWVPRDGNKDSNFNWLNHQSIANFLEDDKLKAKNVIVISDSPFNKRLLSALRGPPFEPDEFQYRKKILDKAKEKSRQVIAFNDKRAQPSSKYEDSSIFAYYVHKALDENWLDVTEFLYLLYNREFRDEARTVAGVKLRIAKLKKTAKEMTGYAAIARVVKAPPINITKTFATPQKDEAGKDFNITATTDRPTYAQVFINIPGVLRRPRPMEREDDGTTWKSSIPIKSPGTFEYTVVAENEDKVEGGKKTGKVEVMVPTEGVVGVVSADVTPKKGNIGQEYSFTAKTDSSAKGVNVVIAGRDYPMRGSGKNWTLKREITEYGNVAYSVIALNDKGIEGLPKTGSLLITAPKIKITSISAPKVYAGDQFTINVTTDYEPKSVELVLGGKPYKMQGSGLNWNFTREIHDIGSQPFTVTAVNTEDERGATRQGTLVAEERPPGIPDIARVTVSPAKPQAGVEFDIIVETKEIAQDVAIVIDGKSYDMTGSGKEWRHKTKIASIGGTKYEITAKNKNGVQGKKREGSIDIQRKQGIDIEDFTVTPVKGYPGEEFTWKAVTREPAASVAITIDGRPYQMDGDGSRRNWTYKRKFDDLGSFEISAAAKDSKDKEGGARTVSLRIEDRIANVRAPANVNVPRSSRGYAGEDFTFEVQTDNNAESVILDLNGSQFDMDGSGRNWTYTLPINEVGMNEYSIIAKNREGKTGRPLTDKFEAKYAILSTTLSPAQILAGESFSISATMNAPASKAVIEIDGKEIPMEGGGTSWRSPSTTIAATGQKNIKITSVARDGKTSALLQKTITIMAPPVNIVDTQVIAKTGNWDGGTFTFRSTTDKDAERVELNLLGTPYPMEKSGNEWTTSIKILKNIKEAAEVNYSVAAFNETNDSGVPYTGSINIEPLENRYTKNEDGTLTDKLSGDRVQRYIDINDDTITDRFAGLMMFREPLRLERTWDETEDEINKYNEDKKYGYEEWRLPTRLEWMDILDKDQTSPPTLPAGNPFGNVNTHNYYWSRTPSTTPGRMGVADLARGRIKTERKDQPFLVWPVRAVEIE